VEDRGPDLPRLAASIARAPRERLSGLAGKLALLVASLTVALLAAEAGVRLLAPHSPSLLVTDRRVGKRFLPGFAGRVYVPECSCHVELRFNRDGLRGPDRPHAVPPGARRIALVGDSMVAAVATAEERTLASLLERRLRGSRPEPGFEVINAGVSSSSTGSELALYREVLAAYSPELVVLVFWVGNDLADNSAELTSAPRLYFDLDREGRLRQLPFGFEPNPLGEWLDRNSALYVWQKSALRQARASLRAARPALEAVELVFASPEPAAVAHAWAITGALLEAFSREAAARGSRLALVAAPAPVQVYDDLWTELAERAARSGLALERDHPERRLAAFCRAAGIPFLALAPSFRAHAPHRDSRRRDEQLYYEGRFHWNDAGNALAAEAVHELVAGSRGGDPEHSF
jgi:lysophospholipase L1-like esterase